MYLFADADNDYVSVGSDEELLEALTATTVQPLKLYIKTKGPGPQSQAAGSILLTQSLAFIRMQIQKFLSIVELKSALW